MEVGKKYFSLPLLRFTVFVSAKAFPLEIKQKKIINVFVSNIKKKILKISIKQINV